MTRHKVDYNKTVIYKIVCNDLAIKDLYVGSTTKFSNRKTCHKANCKNEKTKPYKFKIYQTIREHGGWENWSMIEIEKFPCKNKNEARTRERHWLKQLEANLNMIAPIQTEPELIQYRSNYHKEHAEKIRKYNVEWRKKNAEELKVKKALYRLTHKNEIKEYETTHRDEINKQRRERYAKKRAETQNDD